MVNQSTIGSFSIFQSLGLSWNALRANVWLFAGFSLVYFIASSIIGFIPSFGGITSLFSFIYTASIFSALQVYDTKPELDFNDFFSWAPKFGRLFLGNLLLLVLSVLILIPFLLMVVAILGIGFFTAFMGNMHNPEGFAGLMDGTSIIVLILFVVLFVVVVSVALFAYSFIIQFTELSFTDALKYSFKIGRNNIGQVIIFAFLSLGLAVLGTLFCGVGLLFTIPLIMAIQYYFLKDMIADNTPQPQEQWDFTTDNPE
jgi:hypothetical protein